MNANSTPKFRHYVLLPLFPIVGKWGLPFSLSGRLGEKKASFQ